MKPVISAEAVTVLMSIFFWSLDCMSCLPRCGLICQAGVGRPRPVAKLFQKLVMLALEAVPGEMQRAEFSRTKNRCLLDARNHDFRSFENNNL